MVEKTYQLPIPYGFRNIAWTHDYKGQGHYGKIKGQIKVKPYCTPTIPKQYPYQVSTS